MNELNERSSITSRHTTHYTIMEQPQPGCLNLQLTCCTNVTNRSSHDIEAIPFTSFSTKNKLGVEWFLPKLWYRYSRQQWRSRIWATRDFIDCIYKVSMKTSLDWSNQPKSEPFKMPRHSMVQRTFGGSKEPSTAQEDIRWSSYFQIFHLPGGTKMYHDLKAQFWWSWMKCKTARYIADATRVKESRPITWDLPNCYNLSIFLPGSGKTSTWISL
jgi:hypothetical protein